MDGRGRRARLRGGEDRRRQLQVPQQARSGCGHRGAQALSSVPFSLSEVAGDPHPEVCSYALRAATERLEPVPAVRYLARFVGDESEKVRRLLQELAENVARLRAWTPRRSPARSTSPSRSPRTPRRTSAAPSCATRSRWPIAPRRRRRPAVRAAAHGGRRGQRGLSLPDSGGGVAARGRGVREHLPALLQTLDALDSGTDYDREASEAVRGAIPVERSYSSEINSWKRFSSRWWMPPSVVSTKRPPWRLAFSS